MSNAQSNRSQFATGALMAANILRSERAIQMSVFVVRPFIRMQQILIEQRGLARKLAELEEELTARLDVHETARKNAISGHQTDKFSIFCIQYLDKRKIRPPMGGDMTDNFPLIALLHNR